MIPKKVKILLVSATLPPDNSATAELIKKLLPDLQSHNCEIEGLTVKKSFCEREKEQSEHLFLYKANCVLFAPTPIKCLKDFIFRIRNRILAHKKSRATAIFKEKTVCALLSAMRKMDMQQYDAILAVCAYYDVAEALMRFKEKTPLSARMLLYQVDPLAENKIYQTSDNAADLFAYEETLYKTFDHVFTTPIILKQKKEKGWDMSNVSSLEFPIHLPTTHPNAPIYQTKSEIKCVFAGFLYGTIRDARYTLELFSRMKDKNIHLYFAGTGQEKLLNDYAQGALAGRLDILGQKTAQECDELLRSANVLVNIGNKVNNQVPSKLLHYVGFGKPILNIVAVNECPSIPYMEKYPMAYNIFEKDAALDEDAKKTEAWIQENSSKQISFEQITTNFLECTPPYIANKIFEASTRGDIQ